ncbi:hemerythrin domain-containing protein [Streptomyces sp. NPDC088915]|uniref:hemerythrin domain-containing protein n=1 Tax=Streptomyces sp. NPDC088915 TaxID=3365912 RepID=UPI003820D67E
MQGALPPHRPARSSAGSPPPRLGGRHGAGPGGGRSPPPSPRAGGSACRAWRRRIDGARRCTRRIPRQGVRGEAATRELLLYCHGFCAALDGHDQGEDRTLFPAVEAAHPELRPVLRALEQDHSTIAHLLAGLRAAVDRAAPPEELDQHLEGIAAITESHSRYEERQLPTVLEASGRSGELHRFDTGRTVPFGPALQRCATGVVEVVQS